MTYFNSLLRHTTRNGFGRAGRTAAVAAVLFLGTYAAYGQDQHVGVLGSKDDTLTTGEYTDSYTVFADVGDWVLAVMTSAEFDPYVIIKPPSCPPTGTCEQQRDNDDMQSGDETAVVLVRADEAGTWRVLATSSTPGESGSYQVTVDVADDPSAFETLAPLILSSYEVRSQDGYLGDGDKTLNSGEYVDNYAFIGHAGQLVIIDMLSSEFDPYLILFLPDKSQEDIDDWEGSGEQAKLELILLLDGLYRVSATSFEPGETGRYSLEIRDEVPFVKD